MSKNRSYVTVPHGFVGCALSCCIGADPEYSTAGDSLTSTQLDLNIQSAHNWAAAQLGIDSLDGLDYDTRVQYDRLFAQFILAHPDGYSTTEIMNANRTLGKTYTALDDASFSVKDFAGYTLDNTVAAADKVGDVGRGVISAVSSAGKAVANAGKTAEYVVPVMIIGGGMILLLAFMGKTGGKPSVLRK